ncbi:glycosyltransferase family 4 protein [candidate division KSB1 bacterium]|nr:glycosyltransferase family 4 protein [candidate division KSB1 bacterium]
MKLLIISKMFPNRLEQTFGKFVLDETIELAKMHDVRVIAPIPWFPRLPIFPKWYHFSLIPQQDTINNIPVYYPRYIVTPKIGRSFYGRNYIRGIRRTVARIWSHFQFDLILAHYAYPDGYSAAYYKKLYKRPLVLKLHGSDINEDLDIRGLRKGTLRALQKADLLVPVSRALKEEMLSEGIAAEKIKVINNGINKSLFRRMDRAECRRRLNLPPDKQLILYVGYLDPVKGVPLLIDGFQNYLNLGGNNTDLLLVGDGELREEVKQKINQMNLNQHVKLMGNKSHEQIPLWMNACDALCLSSYFEGYPMVLIEAKSCGLPIVATDVGGIKEILHDDASSRIVPRGDAMAIGRGIQQVLQQNRAAGGVLPVSRSWEDVAEDMNREFKALMGKTGR